jgi:hypothetical protein
MGQTVSGFIQDLVSKEIRRIVADASGDETMVSASALANQVMDIYPNCGLNAREIADQVMMAAARAGMAVEIGIGEAITPMLTKAPIANRARRPKNHVAR